MPTQKRRNGIRRPVNGLSASAYVFFGDGPFFEGRDFEEQASPEERAEIWKAHRGAILERWRSENPQHLDIGTWGETLERLGAFDD